MASQVFVCVHIYIYDYPDCLSFTVDSSVEDDNNENVNVNSFRKRHKHPLPKDLQFQQ